MYEDELTIGPQPYGLIEVFNLTIIEQHDELPLHKCSRRAIDLSFDIKRLRPGPRTRG